MTIRQVHAADVQPGWWMRGPGGTWGVIRTVEKHDTGAKTAIRVLCPGFGNRTVLWFGPEVLVTVDDASVDLSGHHGH